MLQPLIMHIKYLISLLSTLEKALFSGANLVASSFSMKNPFLKNEVALIFAIVTTKAKT